MPNPTAAQISNSQPPLEGTSCRSPKCRDERAPGRRFCPTHVAMFERIADQLPMDFRRGRPAHLGPRD